MHGFGFRGFSAQEPRLCEGTVRHVGLACEGPYIEDSILGRADIDKYPYVAVKLDHLLLLSASI